MARAAGNAIPSTRLDFLTRFLSFNLNLSLPPRPPSDFGTATPGWLKRSHKRRTLTPILCIPHPFSPLSDFKLEIDPIRFDGAFASFVPRLAVGLL